MSANSRNAVNTAGPARDIIRGATLSSRPNCKGNRENGVDDSTTDKPNRKARRAAKKMNKDNFDTDAFIKLADKFIDLANRENSKVKATDLHMAFLYAAARYNAFVAKVILDVEEHEPFVKHMTEQYQEMLRQHLADDKLETPPQPS